MLKIYKTPLSKCCMRNLNLLNICKKILVLLVDILIDFDYLMIKSRSFLQNVKVTKSNNRE